MCAFVSRATSRSLRSIAQDGAVHGHGYRHSHIGLASPVRFNPTSARAGLATAVDRSSIHSPPPPAPGTVKVVEVGARDGLQNEKTPVPTDIKVAFIEKLLDAGVKHLEATSFVSPKWVPQMADASKVLSIIPSPPSVVYNVLTPNLQGFEAALAAARASNPPKKIEVTIFGAATESFSKANINMSIEQSIKRFDAVCQKAREEGVPVRAAVSCVLNCPFEGDVDPAQAARVVKLMYDMGCFEIALGDTTGRGTPAGMKALVRACIAAGVPVERLSAHCHDTFGQGVANVLAAVEEGVRVVDSSAAGLGGCPYSPGATGNVATEDVVYMLHGMGLKTGIDLDKLVDAGAFISQSIGRRNESKVGVATLARRQLKVEKPTVRRDTAKI
ncbi:HMGL-like-domain-containing protein [Gonapodya prolifera JEL478]|uniref:hydroxymethylglutaryl-CoA lyase n=1 Tax=Gonapodya prolifera (strain JEL478) TaxID=1344416 RepID=A0A139AU47_GONPJ|nr:HMGL-like-domain-containing protein [Gonapodya prolifera JEL478]|eukprot:KXS20260.1 HMGL-like-domain-containing protein [Gonapodya prolifera JEL478]